MGKVRLSFLILVGVGVLIGLGGDLWAQPPAIGIDLTLDKTFYRFGEPVGAEVKVRNESGRELLISRGFSSRVYYLDICIMDPAGRLLLGRRDGPHIEAPDAPPLPFVLYQGKLVQVAHCEVLPIGWDSDVSQSRTNDLRAYYAMELPGYYTAQVKVSAKVFKGEPGDPCDVKDYEWVGLLKSEIVYFYMQGSTRVQINPDQWLQSWKEGKKSPDLVVQIWPQEGKTVGDYNAGSLYLNNVPAKRVLVTGDMLTAFFDSGGAVSSLGAVKVGQWYPVVISGRLKSGEPFGGGDEVKIIR